ncbi:MAG TPA: serine hydrolase [Gemmatimonadota bacterium]|nr:serine hydrolase [Gemmatimonadota bacterium]
MIGRRSGICHAHAVAWLVVLSVAVPGLPRAAAQTATVAADGAWLQYADAGESGFSPERLEEAFRYADSVQSGAVMAVHSGRAVVAWGDIARPFESHSARKALVSALYGVAVDRDLIDLDATLADLGIDDVHLLTDAEKSARVVDLISARSGVYHPAAYSPKDMERGLPPRGSHLPGSNWHYHNWDFNTAGAILEARAGLGVREAFDEWIALPTGMEDFDPAAGYDAYEPGKSRYPAQTFRISTRDLARFGQLYLQAGRWGERQVIPADWVERSTQPVTDLGDGEGYGYMWWTYAAGSVSPERYPHVSRYDLYLARGTGGQALFVIPGADLVVVHRGDTDQGREVDGAAVWTIVEKLLAARVGEPGDAPRLVPMTTRPLPGALPAPEPPAFVELERSDIEALLGEYEFGPDMVGRVFLHAGRPYIYVPGEGEAELFALSDTHFIIRILAGVTIDFTKDAAGTVTGVVVRIGDDEMAATKVS